MACKYDYKGNKYTKVEADIASTLHNAVRDQLADSKVFRKKGKQLTVVRTNSEKYKKGVHALASINKRYGASVATTQSDNTVVVNVTPILESYFDAHKRVIDNEFVANEYITEAGDIIVPSDKNMYYQISTKSMDAADTQLNEALVSFATELGVSVKDLDQFKDRFDVDALGVADLLNKIIYISKTGEQLDTLPEEVGHFAIAALKDEALVKRLLDLAEKSPIFDDVIKKYYKLYDGDINRLRFEAAGQLLAEQLIKKSGDLDTSLTATIKRLIDGIWKKFVNKFKSVEVNAIQDAVDKAYAGVTQDILKGDVTAFSLNEIDSSSEAYFQLNKELDPEQTDYDKAITRTIQKLNNQLEALEATVESRGESKALGDRITKLKILIQDQEESAVIKAVVAHAWNDIWKYKRESTTRPGYFQKFDIDNEGVMPEELIVSGYGMVDIHDGIVEDLLLYMTKDGSPEAKKIASNLDKVQTALLDVKRKLVKHRKESAERAMISMNTKEDGTKYDEDLDSSAIRRDVNEDVHWFRGNLLGQLQNSSSDVLRLFTSAVKNKLAELGRYVGGVAKQLTIAQNKMGKEKVKELLEVDKHGKKTHYVISEYNRGDYDASKAEMHQKIADALDFEDFHGIKKYELDEASLDTYVTMLSAWKAENEQVLEDEEGGRKSIPAEKYRNSKFERVMKDPNVKEYYDLYLEIRRSELDKLPSRYQSDNLLYLRPQIKKDIIDRLKSRADSGRSFIGDMVDLTSSGFITEKDDTEYGMTAGSKKVVPVYFAAKLGNSGDITEDLTGAAILFSKMSENFKNSSELLGKAEVLDLSLADRKAGKKIGKESNEYKAFHSYVDSNLLGVQSEAYTVKLESLKGILGSKLSAKIEKNIGKDLADAELNVTKISDKLVGFFRTRNLSFNLVTSASGAIKAAMDAKVDNLIGQVTSVASSRKATAEFLKNAPQVMAEIGKPLSSNKMHLFSELFEATGSVENAFKDLHRNRLARKTLTMDVFMSSYELADYGQKTKSALSIGYNTKLYNGKFILKEEFLREATSIQDGVVRKEALSQKNKEWNELKVHLYDVFEVNKTKHTLEVKPEYKEAVTNQLLNQTQRRVGYLSSKLDGSISPEDKGDLHKKWWSPFLMVHKNWLWSGIDNRMKKASKNLELDMEDVGYYRATSRFLGSFLKEKGSISTKLAVWDTLSEAERVGVRKTMYDVAAVVVTMVVASILNNVVLDDDDDDVFLNYLALQSNRVLLEASAFMNPAEFITLLEQPAAGVRVFEDLMGVITMLPEYDDIVKRGGYKGMTKLERSAWKMSYFKHLYEIRFPKEKNRFIKSVVGNPADLIFAKDK